jgi:hypothetical protein
MKKMSICFGMLIILLSITIFPMQSMASVTDYNKTSFEGFEMVFFRAKIHDLHEEIIHNETYYIFQAETFRGIVFAYFRPFSFAFQRLDENNIETGFPKKNFIGIIREEFVIGMVGGLI